MNIVYAYLQTKTIEKTANIVYKTIINNNIYNIITDPIWAEEYQKSIFGRIIIKTNREINNIDNVNLIECKIIKSVSVETQTDDFDSL